MNRNLYMITLLVILVTGITLGILFVRSCHDPDSGNIVTDTTYTTGIIPGDSVPYEVLVHVPVPVYVDSIIYLPANIDTAVILAEYFQRLYYVDTIYREGNFMAVVKDSVSNNRIVYRAFDFQNLRPTAIYTTNIRHQEYNVPPFGLGVEGIFNSQRFYIGPAVYYMTKNQQVIKVGVMAAPREPIAISMGYYKQINIKK
jgi:hypothetical protein